MPFLLQAFPTELSETEVLSHLSAKAERWTNQHAHTSHPSSHPSSSYSQKGTLYRSPSLSQLRSVLDRWKAGAISNLHLIRRVLADFKDEDLLDPFVTASRLYPLHVPNLYPMSSNAYVRALEAHVSSLTPFNTDDLASSSTHNPDTTPANPQVYDDLIRFSSALLGASSILLPHYPDHYRLAMFDAASMQQLRSLDALLLFCRYVPARVHIVDTQQYHCQALQTSHGTVVDV